MLKFGVYSCVMRSRERSRDPNPTIGGTGDTSGCVALFATLSSVFFILDMYLVVDNKCFLDGVTNRLND